MEEINWKSFIISMLHSFAIVLLSSTFAKIKQSRDKIKQSRDKILLLHELFCWLILYLNFNGAMHQNLSHDNYRLQLCFHHFNRKLEGSDGGPIQICELYQK